MRSLWMGLGFLACLYGLQAQTAPVISPRGVVNAFTQVPAPSTVAPGGLIWINGLNLGPPAGAKAAGPPWPTQLGDPPVEVRINGRPAPLASVDPARIVAQVPWETAQGIANVVVRRGEAASRPARVLISNVEPGLRSSGDSGFGEVAGTLSGGRLALSGSGFGPVEPRVASGEAGPKDPPATPRQSVRAHIGGLPAGVTAALSSERVGEFDIQIEVPSGALAGDVVAVNVGGRAANLTTFGSLRTPELRFLPLPEGAGELNAMVSSDLRGMYLVASDSRDEQGCWPSYLFDFGKQKTAQIDACLTAAGPNAASPVVAPSDGVALGALAGPPQGDLQSGVSDKAVLFHPLKDGPMTVSLPFVASLLTEAPGEPGDFMAVAPGGQGALARRARIDGASGEVEELEGAPGGGGGGALNVLNLQIDLGEGLTHPLSLPVNVQQGVFMLLVGDDADQPKKAKLAAVNPRSEVMATRAYPDGWVPLVPPRQQAPAGLPGAQPGALARPRVTPYYEQQSRSMYVLSRAVDNSRHGFVVFQESDARLIPFPANWYAASCTPNMRVFSIELSRRIALFGTNLAETQAKTVCPAQGFLVLDLADQSMTAVALPGQTQVNAASGFGDLSDFIYATNTDPARRGIADTLFVLDGVNNSAFRLDLPAGVNSFAGLQPFRQMNALIGLATSRAAGDAGLVLFDLEQATARFLPTPDGFQSVQLTGLLPATRKLVARGVKSGATGSQFLVYHLDDEDLAIVPNPPGVAWVGALPGQQQAIQQPRPPDTGEPAPLLELVRTPQDATAKANTVAAFAYDAERKQMGIVLMRVP